MHSVVARERHSGRRTNTTLERGNARRRSKGAAQRAADGQNTGTRERTASDRGSGAASGGRARHRGKGTHRVRARERCSKRWTSKTPGHGSCARARKVERQQRTESEEIAYARSRVDGARETMARRNGKARQERKRRTGKRGSTGRDARKSLQLFNCSISRQVSSSRFWSL